MVSSKAAIDSRGSRGFTIIEVIVVFALISVVAVMSMPFLSGALSRSELDAAVESAADALNEARSGALSGRGAGKFGVHFETDRFVLFVGDIYSVGNPNNMEYVLPGFVSITTIGISGGGADVVYASVAGIPIQTGSLVFTDSAGVTRTVSVNVAGTVESR